MTLNKKIISQVEPYIYYFDSRQVNDFGVSGVYFIIGDGITLIETGTALIAPDILKAVSDIGYKETDIKQAVLTHIHLDHAGGTGWLVNRLPHLKVYVHEKGLKHLHDPTALIESAKMVYGDLNSIYQIHGKILPVPEKNLFPVRKIELDIGTGIRLKIFDAPGHSSHHLCMFEPESGCLFSGEALGHNYSETGTLQPAVAPPAFNFEESNKTIDTIENLKPKKICFSQFGQRNDIAVVIKEARNQLALYYDLCLAGFKQNLSVDEIIQSILKVYDPKEIFSDLINQSMLKSIVVGYQVYFKKNRRLQ
jgi:glyoxylase-like metal-dependent hydrolase (beta-lactamase superfamily II)